jgi:hypothetical protein
MRNVGADVDRRRKIGRREIKRRKTEKLGQQRIFLT